MAIANPSFETAGASAGLASSWTATVVSSVESYSDFSDAGAALTPTEDFGTLWNNGVDYKTALETGDETQTSFNSGSDTSTVESFEAGWNLGLPYLTESPVETAATFGAGQDSDDFDHGWHGIVVATLDHTTDTINAVGHPFKNKDLVLVIAVGGSLPPELDAEVTYHLRYSSANAFQIALTVDGAAVAFSTNGSGTIYVVRLGRTAFVDDEELTEDEDFDTPWNNGVTYKTAFGGGDETLATFDNGTKTVDDFEDSLPKRFVTMQSGATTVDCSVHPYSVDDILQWVGPSIPGGFVSGVDYWVVATTLNTLQLSLTQGGSAIAATTDSLTGQASLIGTPTLYWTEG